MYLSFYLSIYIYIYLSMYIYIYICITHIYIYMYICLSLSLSISISLSLYIYIYTHTHKYCAGLAAASASALRAELPRSAERRFIYLSIYRSIYLSIFSIHYMTYIPYAIYYILHTTYRLPRSAERRLRAMCADEGVPEEAVSFIDVCVYIYIYIDR